MRTIVTVFFIVAILLIARLFQVGIRQQSEITALKVKLLAAEKGIIISEHDLETLEGLAEGE